MIQACGLYSNGFIDGLHWGLGCRWFFFFDHSNLVKRSLGV